MMGKISSDEVRLPLAPLSEVNRAKLYDVIKKYGLVS
jgi:dihydrodipicolinate synthase/N-acetylneuraminate lyase